MGEKTYRTMKISGAACLALGIITLVTGVCVGVLSIINGAVLLKNKSEIIF
jgi:hypothetical protein